MNASFQPDLDFDAAIAAAETGEALVVELDGYEGPLHVLLALARSQKVDLRELSIAKLADQYLAFVRDARRRSISLAADYLVMAAWLAYLKSRLLLPKPADPAEPPATEAAAHLAFRLAKLEAMRQAAEAVLERPQLRRDVFPRGDPEARIVTSSRIAGDLYELMDAYVRQRRRQTRRRYTPAPPRAWPLDDARERLRGILPELERWTPLTGVAPMAGAEGPTRASFVASTLSATLEFVREGELEARQLDHFSEIYLRARRAG
ncbi:MAG: segregation/condensation protein A [Caulobacteraceae bacterium]|nr:segregation/condensation protein A [Caulobacteraceae bacterium]